MSTLNEENFLERLMPSRGSEYGGRTNVCPDADALCSAAEGSGGVWLMRAMEEHLAICGSCAGIFRRMKQFDEPEMVRDEAEWQNAGKRLDNWMRGFAASGNFARGVDDGVAKGAMETKWSWKSFVSWQLPVAAVGVATLALLVIWVARMKGPMTNGPASSESTSVAMHHAEPAPVESATTRNEAAKTDASGGSAADVGAPSVIVPNVAAPAPVKKPGTISVKPAEGSGFRRDSGDRAGSANQQVVASGATEAVAPTKTENEAANGTEQAVARATPTKEAPVTTERAREVRALPTGDLVSAPHAPSGMRKDSITATRGARPAVSRLRIFQRVCSSRRTRSCGWC